MHKKKILLVIIPVLGLVAAVVLVRYSQDIRSRAFTGFSVNSNVSQAIIDNPSPLSAIPIDPSSAQYLFHELANTYPQASTQNIVDQASEIRGTASLAYDQDIDKTLVFIRLENTPYFEFTPMNLWFHNTASSQLKRVAIADFVLEGETPVAYLVYSVTGDIRDEFNRAYISYEKTTETTPVLPIITLTI